MEIENKVANSGIVTLNLEDYYQQGERVVFDLKPLLFQELILKEKDFRDFLKTNNWEIYKNKFVALTCTVDAIVPTWAYMLVTLELEPFAKKIIFGNLSELESELMIEELKKINVTDFADKRVVIKGCGDIDIHKNAFVFVTNLLKPVAKSIMYGEPCSTVPLYKKK